MNEKKEVIILFFCPDDFGDYSLLERKLTNILSSLDSFKAIIFNDKRHLIDRYFHDREICMSNASFLDKKNLSEVTHAIIFNDGESCVDLINTLGKSDVILRIIDVAITKVVNIDKTSEYDVYIGRGSEWGNPYAIGFDGDREEVIRKFKYDFDKGFLKFNKEDVKKLKGKTLGCHCKPAVCHGDVLAEYLNGITDDG